MDPKPALRIPDNLIKYAKNNFVYSTKLVMNALLLHNEYIRDDFYCLQFQLMNPDLSQEHLLKITDITTKEHKHIQFSQLQIDPQGFLIFDTLTQKVFNPRKKLPWISQLDDLIGNTFRIEIFEGKETVLTKFIYLDYFSYENYIIVLIII